MFRTILADLLVPIPGVKAFGATSSERGGQMRIWIIEPDDTCVTTQIKDQIARIGEETGVLSALVSEERRPEERRLYPRLPCFLLVDYAIQGCAYRAFIRNLSADGAFIESRTAAPCGPEIALVISFLEDRRPIKIRGEVVRIGDDGLGVRFDPVADFLPDDLTS